MIINCPNCHAQYEVRSETIGNAGRKVQCASCQTNWRAVAMPEPDTMESDVLFSAEEERELDEVFKREEGQIAAWRQKAVSNSALTEEEKADQKQLAIQRRALRRRQYILHRNLPRARLRRIVIMTTLVMLMTLFGGGLYLRENLVRGLPDLAGLYEAVGLGVNVVGIEFRDVETLKSLRDGVVVMEISAMLENISGRQVSVPAILVSLLDEGGETLFEWSVMPQVSAMREREWIKFETQLAAPPLDADAVRLTFVTSATQRLGQAQS